MNNKLDSPHSEKHKAKSVKENHKKKKKHLVIIFVESFARFHRCSFAFLVEAFCLFTRRATMLSGICYLHNFYHTKCTPKVWAKIP